MDTLTFERPLRRYAINGDEARVIEFDPGDYNLLPRAKAISERLAHDERLKQPDDADMEALAAYIATSDKVVREAIDELFGGPVSDVAFGFTHPLARLRSGKLLYQAFLDAMVEEISAAIAAEVKASKKRTSKYTNKYTAEKATE